ncbi:MAG: TRAP transporter small permease, partial [Rhodospirillaceae bacterium]|nr:TRAP transporter small permease [Rhodospirillaceae bacterium]
MNKQHQYTPTNRVINWVTRFLGALAVSLLFAMMALTFVDVCGRYFFNTPV